MYACVCMHFLPDIRVSRFHEFYLWCHVMLSKALCMWVYVLMQPVWVITPVSVFVWAGMMISALTTAGQHKTYRDNRTHPAKVSKRGLQSAYTIYISCPCKVSVSNQLVARPVTHTSRISHFQTVKSLHLSMWWSVCITYKSCKLNHLLHVERAWHC